VPFGVLVVALWYLIKNVLQKNGYKTDPFRNHTKDIANLHDLINWEKNPQKRRQYTLLLGSFYAALLATVGSFLVNAAAYFIR
jgi:hypothetical protein